MLRCWVLCSAAPTVILREYKDVERMRVRRSELTVSYTLLLCSNYMIPGVVMKGMGGAMDLVSSPNETKVVVLTDHVDKKGRPKIVEQTKLPLTGSRCVSRIITDLCVFDVDRISPEGGLTLTELHEGVTLDEVRRKTGAEFKVAPGVQ